jgi:hypothetical protein
MNHHHDDDIDFKSFISLESLLKRPDADSNIKLINDIEILSPDSTISGLSRITVCDKVDIDTDCNDSKSEIFIVNHSLNELEDTMSKYTDDVKYMWENNIISFMQSQDCYTLDNLKDDDYIKFLNFMMEQRTYKLMMVSYRRLMARKQILLMHN